MGGFVCQIKEEKRKHWSAIDANLFTKQEQAKTKSTAQNAEENTTQENCSAD